MAQPVTQHSFRGGEIAPEFYGNTRNPLHGISLRTCKNFLPIVHGALVNRPGTFSRGAAKTSAPRFEVFVFSDAQALVLEFTDLTVRFWTSSGQVLSGGVPMEVVTPYVAADLPRLKFAQSGDVIRITHRSYAPQDLTRISNTSWTLAAVSFSPPVGFVATALALDANGWAADNGTGWSAVTPYTTGMYVIASDLKCYICLVVNTNQDPTATTGFWAVALDQTRPPKAWDFVVTVRWRDAFGVVREALPSTKMSTTAAIYSDRPLKFHWTAPADPGFPYGLEGYTVYRGRNGVYGWIGDVDGAVTTFKDDGQAPNFGIQPPKGTNPFLIADGVNSAATPKYPACSTFHDQRWVPAGSEKKPSTFNGSATSDINRFDRYADPQDADSYEWRVSSQRLEEIRSAVSFGRLLLFSGQGVFSAHGADGTGITPNAVEVRRQFGSEGASYLDPIETGTELLYNTSKGNRVRDLFFDFNANAFVGADLTQYAFHLFKGYTIVSWAFQETPYKVLWVVRSDGRLFSCTYDRAAQMAAWAQHPTRGQVLQVACIPNGTEDAVFLAVARNGSTRVEVMASRSMPQVADGTDLETGLGKFRDDVRFCCFLDSALQFDGRNTGGTTMRVSGASYDAAAEVTIEASAASFAATDIGDQVVIDPDGTPAVYDAAGNLVTDAVPATSITVTAFTDATHITGRLEAPLPAAFRNAATTLWGWARDTLSGLDHLEGMVVTVLADGVVQGPFTVVAGAIGPLSPPAMIATVGLSYNSDAELLDVAADAAKGNVKSVSRVFFDVVASRGIYAGETFDADDLVEAKLRTVEDDFGPAELVTDQVDVTIGSSWNKGGRACIRQSDPLPLTITSVTRDVEVGGR